MTPEIDIEWKNIDSIVPYERNAKKHPKSQIEKIAKSISEYGFKIPLLIDGSGVIIAGHGRFFAARHLNLKLVPAVICNDLSKEQVKKFRLADNKVAESKWDESMLVEELRSILNLGQAVLDIPGFDEPDIDKLLKGGQDVLRGKNPDKVPDKKSDHGICAGDLFALGEHRLLCGDSASVSDISRLLGGMECNMCFTDPPYNVNYQGGGKSRRNKILNDSMPDTAFYDFMWRVYQGISKALIPGGAFYICHADSMWDAFRRPLPDHELILKQCLIWIKNQFVLSRAHYHYRHEPILYGHKKGKRVWNGGRHNDSVLSGDTTSIVVENSADKKILYINTPETSIVVEVDGYRLVYQDAGTESVWHFPKPQKSKDHPTMKPVELVKRGIRNSSLPGQKVFDPFLGSGTTLIAAETINRVCYGLELSPDYCDVIIRRWEDYTGDKAVQIGSAEDHK